MKSHTLTYPGLRKIQLYTLILSIAVLPLLFFFDSDSGLPDAGTYITIMILLGTCQVVALINHTIDQETRWPLTVFCNCVAGYLLGFFIAISAALMLQNLH